MSLSDKMIVCKCNVPNCNQSLFYEEDVKEFIKDVIKIVETDYEKELKIKAIKKLVGEKLI